VRGLVPVRGSLLHWISRVSEISRVQRCAATSCAAAAVLDRASVGRWTASIKRRDGRIAPPIARVAMGGDGDWSGRAGEARHGRVASQ